MRHDGPSLRLDLDIPEPSSATNKPRQGNLILPVILLVILLLLVYAYTYINEPPGDKKPAAKGMTHLFSIYGFGTKPNELLVGPNDVAFDARGNIYVADSGSRRIVVFDGSGEFLRRFPFSMTKKAQWDDKPIGITVDTQGRVYATSMDSDKLFIFDNDGKPLANVHIPLPIKPQAIGNKLYITTAGQLVVFDINKGDIDKWLGSYGREKGQMVNPNGVDVAANGDVWLSDSLNSRIQIFDTKGKPKKVIGKPPKDMNDSKRLFGTGSGLVLDDQGFAYVTDTLRHSIRVFSPAGKHLLEVGSEGDNDGYFQYPAGIAYGGGHTFAVADKANHRIQVLTIIPPGAAISPVERVQQMPAWLAPLLVLLALLTAYLLYRRLRARQTENITGEGVPDTSGPGHLH